MYIYFEFVKHLYILLNSINRLVELIKNNILYGIRFSLLLEPSTHLFPIVFSATHDSPVSSPTSLVIILAPDYVPHLITINVTAQAPLKLTHTNYFAWRLQFTTLIIGYDLVCRFVDSASSCPPPTLTTTNDLTPNPSYSLWVHQDQLILNAIIGSIMPTLIPFITTATTSHAPWTTLFNTYAKPYVVSCLSRES